MELLEGQTLRDRIAGKERFPIHQLLDLSMQITAGLEAAHQQGIIHRDIKPANIFITSRGEAKILDFGLAKLGEVEQVLFGTEPNRAVYTNITRTSIAMGTAAYMSPEQVRGETLDTRTDLFSFGLVLYEMATMRQAFSGETAAILYDSIVNREPVPALELSPELPPRLAKDIINKALQKERQLRYQTASEIRADLNSVALGLSQGKRNAKTKGRRTLAPAAAIVATLLIGAAILWFAKTQTHSLHGPLDLKQRQLTTNSSENAVSSGSISPDGRYLAYADLRGIHIKLIETGETRTVPQPEILRGSQVNWGIVSNWASDGSRFIANANVSGKPPSIWAIPTMGGTPRKLRDDAYAWAGSRDGLWVAFTANLMGSLYREMWRMRLDGGQAGKLFEADNKSGLFGAEWSPDGNRLSYFAAHHQATGNSEINIESRDLHGGAAVVAGPGNVADWTWSPDGRMIYILAEASPLGGSCNFWEKYIDGQTGRPKGIPRRLTNWAGFCMEDPSVTANAKRLAFRKLLPQSNVYVADIQTSGARLGPSRRLTLTEGQNYPFAWTSDSQAVVFESYRDGLWSIFRQLLGDDTAEPIVTGIQDEGAAFATVSSNGKLLLYVVRSMLDGSSISGPDNLMRVPIRGGPPELVLTARIYGKPVCARSRANLCAIAEPAPDGKQFIFTAFDPEKGRLGELARFDSGPATGTHYLWDLSPDGTRIAILKYSQGVIDILPLNGELSQKVAVKGWSSLLSLNWDSLGKGIFASSQTKTGSVLLRVSLTGDAQVLWEQNGSIAPWNRPFPDFPSAPWAVPSPDGRRLAIYSWTISSNMWMIENF